MKKLRAIIGIQFIAIGILLSGAVFDAVAHGGLKTVATVDDVTAVFGEGVTLKTFKLNSKGANPYQKGKGKIIWSRAIDQSGSLSGYVGMEKLSTEHGGLLQATCFEIGAGKVRAVIVMKATGDEIAAIKKVTAKSKWWLDPAPKKESLDASVVLRRSVARLMAEFLNADIR